MRGVGSGREREGRGGEGWGGVSKDRVRNGRWQGRRRGGEAGR